MIHKLNTKVKVPDQQQYVLSDQIRSWCNIEFSPATLIRLLYKDICNGSQPIILKLGEQDLYQHQLNIAINHLPIIRLNTNEHINAFYENDGGY